MYLKKNVIAVIFLFLLVLLSVNVYSDGLYRVNENNIKSFRNVGTGKLYRVKVTRVIDGDTVEVLTDGKVTGLEARERVRLLGIDTPEIGREGKEDEKGAKEALRYLQGLVEGKEVYLAFDWDLRDRYGRLLAYIYLGNGECVNYRILENGLGKYLGRFRFQFMGEFQEAENRAKRGRKGLWR